MSKEMLHIIHSVQSVANEKGVPEDTVFDAMSKAMAAIAASQVGGQPLVRADIDRTTGDIACFQQWHVVADDFDEATLERPDEEAAQDDRRGPPLDDEDDETVLNPDRIMRLRQARDDYGDVQPGDIVEAPIEVAPFGRIAVHQAKHIIMRLVRDAERLKMAATYEKRVGELVHGQVKRVTRDGMIVDLSDNVEGFLPRSQMIPKEIFRLGDRFRAYLQAVKPEGRGPLVQLSRTCPEMLMELFRLEVPEISEGAIDILAVARDPGVRAKIAVKSKDSRIDPIGACVGMRGSRVQAVSTELHGERVDIILWNDNPAHLVISAMAPAEVRSVAVDEANHSMDVAVDEDQLSQAIGRSGQNVRLASELSGWQLNVMTPEAAKEKTESQHADMRAVFMEGLDVDADIADILVREGFSTLDDLAYADPVELQVIEEFTPPLVEALRSRAKAALFEQAMMSDNPSAEPAEDLLELEGMNRQLAYALASKGIVTRDDLADCSVDELEGMPHVSPAQAGELIMKARATWFEDDAS